MIVTGEDPRELILVRLFELMTESYINAETVVRNRALLSNDARPAIALLDGDETPRLTGDGLGRGRFGRVKLIPQLMMMRPQVCFIAKSKKPKNEGLGTEVNLYRDLIVRVVAQDPQLLTILGSAGSVAYMGMETDLKAGSRLDGEAKLDFTFTYLYDPS